MKQTTFHSSTGCALARWPTQACFWLEWRIPGRQSHPVEGAQIPS
jgi:hypothetical protein